MNAKHGKVTSFRLDPTMAKDFLFIQDYLQIKYTSWKVQKTTIIAFALRDCAANLRCEKMQQRKPRNAK